MEHAIQRACHERVALEEKLAQPKAREAALMKVLEDEDVMKAQL